MQLPLFHGVSAQQLSALVEKMPFHFLKFADGDTIINEGDECTHMRFVVSGRVKVLMRFKNLDIVVEQTLDAPNVLAPDYLFGLETSYPFSVIAHGECGIMQLRKTDYISVVQSDKVFLFNVLSYLSRNSQRFAKSLLTMKNGSLTERIALLVAFLTTQLSSDVTISFQQKDMCTVFGTQRSTLIHALEGLQANGLIKFSTTSIEVIKLAELVALTKE